MILDIVYIIGGLLLLLGGGHFLVNAGVSAASKFKIAPFIIGATVVAFGTSAPELIVSIDASLGGHPAMALGNVIGSNIANIALVLGTTACLITLPVQSKRLFSDWLLVIVSSILLFFFAAHNGISTIEGIGFIIILLIYITKAIRSPKVEDEEVEGEIYNNWGIIILAFIASGFALSYGARFLVDGASNIARLFNVSERIIAITIVAFGTSLPELATSVIAAIKKQTDISIGNIIGSNLFNILAVIGISSTIKSIEINFEDFRVDLIVMLGVAFLLFLLIYPYKHNINHCKKKSSLKGLTYLTSGKLTYKGGIVLLLTYFGYLYLLLGHSSH